MMVDSSVACTLFTVGLFPWLSGNRKSQDYVYGKGEYKNTWQNIKHHLEWENKTNKNKVLICYEILQYMYIYA